MLLHEAIEYLMRHYLCYLMIDEELSLTLVPASRNVSILQMNSMVLDHRIFILTSKAIHVSSDLLYKLLQRTTKMRIITLMKADFPATIPETLTAEEKEEEEESKVPVEHNNMINITSHAFLQIAPILLMTIESA